MPLSSSGSSVILQRDSSPSSSCFIKAYKGFSVGTLLGEGVASTKEEVWSVWGEKQGGGGEEEQGRLNLGQNKEIL